MKVRENTTKVYRTEDYKETYFGIDNDEDLVHIFNILRSKIYTDKILAVVREYSTNAQDAHIMAGTPDRPIDVTLPTKLMPNLVIRDYGPGLSEDAVRTVYVKYGKSTKRDSNDFNGQLGLGCKAGFAYGDSFLITSYKDGKQMSFEAMIDETKIGVVSLLLEKETTEPNGIKITIPVKSADVSAFKDTARSFYKYFKPAPNVPGLTFEKEIVLFEGKNWKVLEDDKNYYNNQNARAFMGNVAYPIDVKVLQKSVSPKRWHKIANLFHAETLLSFDIGDLSIASSREGLEYDKPTVKILADKMEEVVNEIISEVEKDFTSAKDIFEARTLWKDYFAWNGKKKSLSKFISKTDIVWNGKQISNELFTWGADSNAENSAVEVTLDSNKQTGVSQRHFQDYHTWRHTDKTAYIINDAENRWILRLRKYFELHPHKTRAIVFKYGSDAVKSKEAWGEFLKTEYLEDSHFTKLSTVEPLKIVRAASAVLPKHKAKVFTFNPANTRASSLAESWDVSDVDLKKVDGCYVTINRFVPTATHDSGPSSNSQLKSALAYAKDLFGVDLTPTLIGVKKSIAPKVGKTWPSLQEKILELFEAKITDSEMIDFLAMQSYLKNADVDLASSIKRNGFWKDLNPQPGSVAEKAITLVKQSQKIHKSKSNDFHHITQLSSYFNLNSSLEGKLKDRKEEIEKIFKEFQERYPMINCAVSYSHPSATMLQDYMLLIDQE